MTVTPSQRKAFRHCWRGLVDSVCVLARSPASPAATLHESGRGSRNWILPTDDRAENEICAAFGPMVAAYARAGTVRLRTALAVPLLAWADQVAAILDRAEGLAAAPSSPLTPPMPRHRLDLDGPADV